MRLAPHPILALKQTCLVLDVVERKACDGIRHHLVASCEQRTNLNIQVWVVVLEVGVVLLHLSMQLEEVVLYLVHLL